MTFNPSTWPSKRFYPFYLICIIIFCPGTFFLIDWHNFVLLKWILSRLTNQLVTGKIYYFARQGTDLNTIRRCPIIYTLYYGIDLVYIGNWFGLRLVGKLNVLNRLTCIRKNMGFRIIFALHIILVELSVITYFNLYYRPNMKLPLFLLSCVFDCISSSMNDIFPYRFS